MNVSNSTSQWLGIFEVFEEGVSLSKEALPLEKQEGELLGQLESMRKRRRVLQEELQSVEVQENALSRELELAQKKKEDLKMRLTGVIKKVQFCNETTPAWLDASRITPNTSETSVASSHEKVETLAIGQFNGGSSDSTPIALDLPSSMEAKKQQEESSFEKVFELINLRQTNKAKKALEQLKKEDVNKVHPTKEKTLLFLAAMRGQKTLVEELLKMGANPAFIGEYMPRNAQNPLKGTALEILEKRCNCTRNPQILRDCESVAEVLKKWLSTEADSNCDSAGAAEEESSDDDRPLILLAQQNSIATRTNGNPFSRDKAPSEASQPQPIETPVSIAGRSNGEILPPAPFQIGPPTFSSENDHSGLRPFWGKKPSEKNSPNGGKEISSVREEDIFPVISRFYREGYFIEHAGKKCKITEVKEKGVKIQNTSTKMIGYIHFRFICPWVEKGDYVDVLVKYGAIPDYVKGCLTKVDSSLQLFLSGSGKRVDLEKVQAVPYAILPFPGPDLKEIIVKSPELFHYRHNDGTEFDYNRYQIAHQ